MARYSHSRLSSHQNCPRKFLWQYVWNVRPDGEGIEAFLGKRLHESLEALYLQVVDRGVPPSLPDLLLRFEQLWDHHWHDDVRIVREGSADDYRDVGRQCLERYYRAQHPFRSGATVGLEKEFQFRVSADSPHFIRGYLDRIDIAPDGTVEVHDYKSGRRVPDEASLSGDLQVALYEMAAWRLYPEHRGVRMVWHYLQSGVQRRLPHRDRGELDGILRSTETRIDGIESHIDAYRSALGEEERLRLPREGQEAVKSVPTPARRGSPLFPARVGPLCRWCSLLAWCDEGSHHVGAAFEPPPPPPEPAPAPRPAILDLGGQARLF